MWYNSICNEKELEWVLRKGVNKMENLNLELENVKSERESMDEYDREVYDFKTFRDCQRSLDV